MNIKKFITISILLSSSILFTECMEDGLNKLIKYAPLWEKLKEDIFYNMQLAPTAYRTESIKDSEGNILIFNPESVTIIFNLPKENYQINVANETFKQMFTSSSENN